jgi:hypothetical protein
LDVHKDSVYACVRRLDARSRSVAVIRVFGTTTPDLLTLGIG